jgi:hypothetical protein
MWQTSMGTSNHNIYGSMTNNKQKTGVDLFYDELVETTPFSISGLYALYKKAKKIEKEQIAEAYWNGSDGIEDKTSMLKIGEEYYKETYGDEQQ